MIPTVAPDLAKRMAKIRMDAFERHWRASAAGPGVDESEEEFYERQQRQALRQFTAASSEQPPEETVARAS